MVLLGYSWPSTHGTANQPYTSLTVHLDASDTCSSHDCLKAMHTLQAVCDYTPKHWLQSTMVSLNFSSSCERAQKRILPYTHHYASC